MPFWGGLGSLITPLSQKGARFNPGLLGNLVYPEFGTTKRVVKLSLNYMVPVLEALKDLGASAQQIVGKHVGGSRAGIGPVEP